jgi:drug/metabolite transporter (DMT)-like permease
VVGRDTLCYYEWEDLDYLPRRRDSILSRSKAVILLITTGLLWSVIGVITKSISWHPISIAGGLSLFAALTHILLARRFPRVRLDIPNLGALLFCLNTLLFIGAIHYSSVANAVVLQFTAPVYVAILGGVVLGEHMTSRDWLALVFTLLGTTLFFLDDLTPVQLTGTLMAVASGLSVAGYTICLRKLKSKDPIDVVILGEVLVFVISIPWLFNESFSSTALSKIVILGTFCYGISFLAYAAAIRHVRALEALLISTSEIVLGPIWAFIFLHEKPSGSGLLGATLISLIVLIYGCESRKSL